MKAKNLYLMAFCASAVALSSNVASAQDVFVDDAATVTEFTCDNTNHYFSNWRNNWFIEVSAGANSPITEQGWASNPKNQLSHDKWTATYSVGFGRWFSPYLGFRIKAVGGSIHWDAEYPGGNNVPSALGTSGALNGFSHMLSAGLHAELMWDMCNSIRGYNPNRVFSVIPFVGIGGEATWNFYSHNAAGYRVNPQGTDITRAYWHKYDNRAKNVQWTLPVSAGLQFRFRLCKYVDFFAEARATMYGDNWNNDATGSSVDCLVSAMGGFNFNIGGRSFNTFNECNYVSQIAALNGQVNDLRSQLLACGQQVAALQAQLPCPEVVAKDCVNAPLMATVRFTINSAKILPTEEVNIYNMAEWLKANPNEKIAIVGYADKDTGTADYNMQLSERRANAVADCITNTYGIDPSRYTVSCEGSDVQPYQTNDWNRIVIFTQK